MTATGLRPGHQEGDRNNSCWQTTVFVSRMSFSRSTKSRRTPNWFNWWQEWILFSFTFGISYSILWYTSLRLSSQSQYSCSWTCITSSFSPSRQNSHLWNEQDDESAMLTPSIVTEHSKLLLEYCFLRFTVSTFSKKFFVTGAVAVLPRQDKVTYKRLLEILEGKPMLYWPDGRVAYTFHGYVKPVWVKIPFLWNEISVPRITSLFPQKSLILWESCSVPMSSSSISKLQWKMQSTKLWYQPKYQDASFIMDSVISVKFKIWVSSTSFATMNLSDASLGTLRWEFRDREEPDMRSILPVQTYPCKVSRKIGVPTKFRDFPKRRISKHKSHFSGTATSSDRQDRRCRWWHPNGADGDEQWAGDKVYGVRWEYVDIRLSNIQQRHCEFLLFVSHKRNFT